MPPLRELDSAVIDPKPAKRIRDPEAGPRKLAKFAACRGCGTRASDSHHILLRSQGGDDHEDNIMPLCHLCHIKFHDGNLDIRLKLTADERAYLEMKLGRGAAQAYIERRYG